MTRVMVGCDPKTLEALDLLQKINDKSKSACIAEAIKVYAYFLDQQRLGNDIYRRNQDTGAFEVLRFI